MIDSLGAFTAQIVAGYVRKNQVGPDALPPLIRTVYDSLQHLGVPAVIQENRPAPAVPIRRSVTDEHIICLDCGYRGQMIKRHLQTKHNGMTPEQYRQRWGLPTDYPMLARGYSEKRSQLAKSIGLGQRGRGRPAPEPPAPEPAPAPPTRGRSRAAKPAGGEGAAKPARRSRAKASAPGPATGDSGTS